MADDKLFNFLIYRNGQLAISKYNFNFSKFQTAIGSTGDLNDPQNKISLFAEFIRRNGSTLQYPTFIKVEYEQFFDPITADIKAYVSKYGIIHSLWNNYIGIDHNTQFFEEHQFELYPYKDSIRIQDFIYSNSNFDFNKFNFKFDKYMQDWIISDNKLVAFTDFIFRNYKSTSYEFYNDSPYRNLPDGYVVLPGFKQYFSGVNQELINYITTYSVSSHNSLSDRTLDTTDFTKYSLLNFDLPNFANPTIAKEHFISYGQFEQRILSFKFIRPSPIQEARTGVASVFLKTKNDSPLSTGFLFKQDDDTDIYLITVYHLIARYPDQRYLYAIFENDAINNFSAQFRIIGYDTITDVMVAIYDPSLNYNQLFNVDWYKQIFLNIDYSYKAPPGEVVHLIGNIGFNDNLSTIQTVIMNDNYSGGFGVFGSSETMPNSLLLQFSTSHGTSGSPILQGDPTGTSRLNIIGMLIGSLVEAQGTLIAIDNYVLLNVIFAIIQKWNLLLSLQIANTISDINTVNRVDDFIKNGYPKAWLGIANQYNHPILAGTYKELSNLSYIGGLLVTNFIIGFNYRDENFVYTSRDLIDRNVFQIQGPLINTSMYTKFISNGSVPIIIKSITFYDGIQTEMVKLHIGKFGQQQSYSRFVYAQNYITLLNSDTSKNYYNLYILQFGPIIIEYYYYDGKQWNLETEQIGGNEEEWYVNYSDNIGNIYHQHKFEYPMTLLPYFSNYSISKYAVEGLGLGGNNEQFSISNRGMTGDGENYSVSNRGMTGDGEDYSVSNRGLGGGENFTIGRKDIMRKRVGKY